MSRRDVKALETLGSFKVSASVSEAATSRLGLVSSVATHLRCGGINSNSFITSCLLISIVKIFFKKSVNIIAEIIRCTTMVPFFGPSCILHIRTAS